MALSERVRQRLRDEKARRELSDRDLSGIMNWSQAKVSQKLLGHTAITLDELDALCFALGGVIALNGHTPHYALRRLLSVQN